MSAYSAMADPQTELIDDLHRHIYEAVRSRAGSGAMCWVMNQEWVNECRKLEPEAGPAFWHFDRVGEYMLGIPIKVREDGGLPHIEPA
jgi:hypothetical protein